MGNLWLFVVSGFFSYTKKLYENSFYEFFKCYPRRYHRSKKIQQN